MERLENKIAVITGASTGIGQASAVALAKEGAHVLAPVSYTHLTLPTSDLV